MKGPFSLGRLANGCVDELASRIVAADAQGLVVWAISNDMCTRVWHVAEWVLIRWDMAVSLGLYAIVELPVYKL